MRPETSLLNRPGEGLAHARGSGRDIPLLWYQIKNQAIAAAAPAIASVVAPTKVQPENIVVQRERSKHKLVEQFLKLSPPRFTGIGDLEVASLWIQDLEKAFALLMCTKVEKVTQAVYQLHGNANVWWRATKDTIFPEGGIPVWDAFLRAFNDQYFSGMGREQKMEEFQCLRQGSMSVDQYGVKFAELSQYAPRLVEDLEEKARRFRNGLRSELK
ncbi:uncharacterized protein LOC120296056 [Eucalyptus grandis]|uniref:uncharacterized protein LOC120296056 n=1 Tax=Eucalyptus grandis TaxID=71139 RepID=UPI00192EFC00|nr:uncharacterized protein LOC120296056 [Eucalyptus grandis]